MKKETLLDLISELVGTKTETINNANTNPFEIGKCYLIRTVTLYYTGKVKAHCGQFMQLEEAAWIPDTGRWAEACEKGTFNEVEPFANDPWINLQSIIDTQEITYKLPKTTK